jgi:hypothetical protein
MNNQQVKELFKKYAEGKCNPEEVAWIESWYLKTSFNETVPGHDEIEAAFKHDPNRSTKHETPVRRLFYLKIAAAAAIIASVSVSVYFLKFNGNTTQNNVAVVKGDLPPGTNKAILTLGNGRQIVLTGAANGKIAVQGTTTINKTSNGQIVYTGPGNDNPAVIYNTVTTPRGGEYHLTLADGTDVWLNAASSVTYPTVFNGSNRTVQITGEAYFEVAPDKHKPFRVSTEGQTIEVLGTHFNINAYQDESAMKTTLFEGSVKISKGNAHAILKPGQQAIVSSNASAVAITDDFNADQVIAWKKGKFYFEYSDVQNVMRQIGRWYDVDIIYQGKIPDKRLSGSFSKYMNASKALSILEYAGVNFKIEGRKIIVK